MNWLDAFAPPAVKKNILDITPREFLQAYKNTGLQPISGFLYVNDLHKGPCGCAIGAYVLELSKRPCTMSGGEIEQAGLSRQGLLQFGLGYDQGLRGWKLDMANDLACHGFAVGTYIKKHMNDLEKK